MRRITVDVVQRAQAARALRGDLGLILDMGHGLNLQAQTQPYAYNVYKRK